LTRKHNLSFHRQGMMERQTTHAQDSRYILIKTSEDEEIIGKTRVR
jgi:hypothetical protein